MRTNSLCISVYILAAFFTQSLSAEPCKPGKRPLTTPTERFTLSGKGSVLDKTTGLTWMRCSVGQQWAGNNCAGEAARYTWQDADWVKDTVNLDGYADHTDWRIPVVPELASIVELGCVNGRVNPIVFPSTPSVAFWSSMEKPGAQDYAYTLNFGAGGGATPSLKSTQGALRLVRGGPWWTPPKR